MPQRKLHKVMFVCTGNACRSQMAEGFARELGKDLIGPYSAGLTPCSVHPLAILVMHELGVDISVQKSKAIDSTLMGKMDFVITLCDHADTFCPFTPPEVRRVHIPVHDPVGTIGTEKEILCAFRKARDDIRDKVLSLTDDLRKISLMLNKGEENSVE